MSIENSRLVNRVLRYREDHPVRAALVGITVAAGALAVFAPDHNQEDSGPFIANPQPEPVSQSPELVPYFLGGRPMPRNQIDLTPNFTHEPGDGSSLSIACAGVEEVLVVEGVTVSGLAELIETRKVGVDLPGTVPNSAKVGIITELNRLKDPNSIQIGEVLAVPDVCAVFAVHSELGG
jgi:hypothetical protein